MVFYSAIEPIYFILPFTGFVIGLFGSILGGGGGFFFLPILTLLVGVPAQTAVITSLVATLPVCAVGATGHYRKGNIDLNKGTVFIITGIAGAFAGTLITNVISTEQLKTGFGLYSVVIAFNMALSTWRKKRAESTKTAALVTQRTAILHKSKGPFYGFLAGTITGTFGTSGTAPVLAGLFSMNVPIKLVIGTSLMVVLANTFFAVGAHFLVGRIDLTLVFFLTSGSVIGALIGPGIMTKAKTEHSENNIRYIYALVMMTIGGLMIIA
ncbi:MAG: sulfite exporter TauE/SafE family protein [Marinilabilia sp.]